MAGLRQPRPRPGLDVSRWNIRRKAGVRQNTAVAPFHQLHRSARILGRACRTWQIPRYVGSETERERERKKERESDLQNQETERE